MPRLIDADVLHQAFFTMKMCIIRNSKGKWQGAFTSDQVHFTIDDQPTIDTKQQWIPCKERLPAENGAYLVYAPDYRGGSSSGKEWHDGIMFAKFKAGKWSIEHGYYSRPNCVIAWMPMPKPYEAKHE